MWSTFAVSGGVGFRYITEPTNWPKFWLDLMDIPDLDRARWRHPGDSVRLEVDDEAVRELEANGDEDGAG